MCPGKPGLQTTLEWTLGVPQFRVSMNLDGGWEEATTFFSFTFRVTPSVTALETRAKGPRENCRA